MAQSAAVLGDRVELSRRLARAARLAPNDPAAWQRIRTVRAQLGGTLGSFESWLLLRGMRTLYLRVRQASASAHACA